MGNTTSKGARKLSREKPSWATRVSTPQPTRPLPEGPLAFESKDEAIERDAKDPHFVQRLNQLGPVRTVEEHRETVRAASDVQSMYYSRMRSEAEAANPRSAKNRILVASLAELLEARKLTASRAELERLAEQHHVDVATLERLGRVVNTPSIDESTVVRTTDEHGEQSLTMMARWVDPVFPRV